MAFQYYSSSGYDIGGSQRFDTTPAFYIDVDGTEMKANLPDFESFTFVRKEKDTELTLSYGDKQYTRGKLVPILLTYLHIPD